MWPFTLYRDMLKLGSSRHWQDAMEVMTGQREMRADALLEYFRPLQVWLEEQNKGYDVTWDDECPGSRMAGVARISGSVTIITGIIGLSLCVLIYL